MTEFVVMGLLPDIAGDLLPTLWASSPEDAPVSYTHLTLPTIYSV